LPILSDLQCPKRFGPQGDQRRRSEDDSELGFRQITTVGNRAIGAWTSISDSIAAESVRA
jgi:hypothetical protein